MADCAAGFQPRPPEAVITEAAETGPRFPLLSKIAHGLIDLGVDVAHVAVVIAEEHGGPSTPRGHAGMAAARLAVGAEQGRRDGLTNGQTAWTSVVMAAVGFLADAQRAPRTARP